VPNLCNLAQAFDFKGIVSRNRVWDWALAEPTVKKSDTSKADSQRAVELQIG
jgi:hypothetical protein